MANSTLKCTRRSGLFRRFQKCESASIAVIAALSLPVLIGLTGMAVDVGGWYVKKRSLQSAADAAAITGAHELSGGSDQGQIESAALSDAQDNKFDESGTGVMTVSVPPTDGAYAADSDAVEVVLTEDAPLYFSALFLDHAITIEARAVAKHFTTGNMCMIALDGSVSQALLFSGSAEINMDCGIASNSTDAASIYADGNVDIQVSTAWSMGGISHSDSVNFQASTLRENASETSDPYSDLAVPAFAGCDQDGMNINSTTTLFPGVYCNGLSLGGNAEVNMEPGVYTIDRGSFTMNGNARLEGEGVTIILTSSTGADYGEISISGNIEISLSAPHDGETAGVVLFQDRNSPSSGNAVINGSNESGFTGAVYLPTQQLEFGGTGDVEEMCVQLIARTIWVHGNVAMQSECGDQETEDVKTSVVRQVE